MLNCPFWHLWKELVEPRALLLAELGRSLDQAVVDWALVFDQCRRQRVNSNLLVDHSGAEKFPARDFFEKVMVEQNRKTIAAFNVFLFELEEKNVTENDGLYFDIYRREPKKLQKSKISTVCQGLCDVIQSDQATLARCYSIYLHCKLKMDGMFACMGSLSQFKKRKLLDDASIQNAIKFLAVMQQESVEKIKIF